MDTIAPDPARLEKATMRRVLLRLVPFLMVCYFFALLDRAVMVNVVGVTKEWTGSFVLGMLLLALLCGVAAVGVLVLGRSAARAAHAADVATVKP